MVPARRRAALAPGKLHRFCPFLHHPHFEAGAVFSFGAEPHASVVRFRPRFRQRRGSIIGHRGAEAQRGNISGLSVSLRPSSGRTADGFVITFSGRSMNLAAVGGAKAPTRPHSLCLFQRAQIRPPENRTGFGPILVLRLENRCASAGHTPALGRAPGKPDHFQTTPGVFAVVQFCRQQAKPRTPVALTIGYSAGALLPKLDGVTELIFKEPTSLRSKT